MPERTPVEVTTRYATTVDEGSTGPVHGRCMGCFPAPGPATALCGATYEATDRLPLNHVPVDACIDCVAAMDRPYACCGALWEGTDVGALLAWWSR